MLCPVTMGSPWRTARFQGLAAAAALGGCIGELQVASENADAAAVSDAATGTDAAQAPCPRVAHIGDSLTAATLGPLAERYQAAGVTVILDAYGGRAVLQKLAADPRTGKQVALDLRAAGFDGCWVVALGTNDTANVAAGAWYSRARTIDEMMTAIDPGAGASVLWVSTFTTRSSGPYANAHMDAYNQALREAQGRWPNLELLDWAAVAAGGTAPFTDGIHHTADGYAVRNETIVRARVGH
jgi:hypothetical protein